MKNAAVFGVGMNQRRQFAGGIQRIITVRLPRHDFEADDFAPAEGFQHTAVVPFTSVARMVAADLRTGGIYPALAGFLIEKHAHRRIELFVRFLAEFADAVVLLFGVFFARLFVRNAKMARNTADILLGRLNNRVAAAIGGAFIAVVKFHNSLVWWLKSGIMLFVSARAPNFTHRLRRVKIRF